MEEIFLAQEKLNENTIRYQCWDENATTEGGYVIRW
jgi:hypothetical protein